VESPADCLFCRIVAGELPSERVDEDDRALAFVDINPSTRGHTLVVPKRHSSGLYDIPPEDLAACMAMAKRIAASVTGALGAEGVNLLNNTGRAAGQVVFHFHLHVIPRYGGDAFRNPLDERAGDAGDVAAAAEALRGAIRGG
jgi:histidine triad (HIT) family protein